MNIKVSFLFCIIMFPFLLRAGDKKLNILIPGEGETWSSTHKKEIPVYFGSENYLFSWIDTEKTNWRNADLRAYDIIWLHEPDSTKGSMEYSHAFYKALVEYLNEGGNILLTQHALGFLNTSGLEPVQVKHRAKHSEDNGYGRMLGFHAFLGHPLFDSLNGGAYVWKPPYDTIVTQCGFFGQSVPENGKVIAVDWDYIFVREDARLIVEYNVGKGKIIGIGAYFNLSGPNLNRAHFDLLYQNVFNYLTGSGADIDEHYWLYGEQQAKPIDNILERQLLPPAAQPWHDDTSSLAMFRDAATSEYCEVAGKRLLVAAYEPGGIFEVWAHPFMALKNYHASLLIDGAVVHLSKLKPSIRITPAAITRTYHINNEIRLKEIMTVSPSGPVGVIHYEYRGPETKLSVAFSSNMRLMWPYSENVLKTIEYGYQPTFNAVEVTAPEAGLSTFVGASMIPVSKQFTEHDHNSGDSIFSIEVMQQYTLENNDALDIIFAAGSEGRDSLISSFMNTMQDAHKLYLQATGYYNSFNSELLSIHTPDDNFNKGYAWALAATDRFFVKTPGLGTSLVAGYNGTDRGWDGGHAVNGRPGYAWYFGRDAVWSALAVLDYGDHAGVRDVLDMLIKYQDLSGKIFHELSTSGFVHYDASDATPLFIILAGRYLQHSGDTAYIRQNWPAIKKAVEYCKSTDTDGDGLIENTNVGHGWVEGGPLFGSHTSLYLASCWIEALRSAAIMAEFGGEEKLSGAYIKESMRLRSKISADFYNPSNDFLYQGIFKDGTYHKGESILPSIPIYFGQLPSLQSVSMLEAFASSEYTTDWGVRITSHSAPHYHPQAYHSGSVWPLFTGWVALAEYKEKRHIQGFGHIMANLNIYRDFSLAYLEEVLHGEKYTPSGVCPHQCWSQTMVIQPIIEGMLGLEPDATSQKLKFGPALPPQWDSVTVRNIKIGQRLIDWKMKREPNTTSYYFSGDVSGMDIYFEPVMPEGTVIDSILMNNASQEINVCTACQGITLKLFLQPEGDTEIRIFHKKGFGLIPPISKASEGQASEGVRIINTNWHNNICTITLEGAAAKRYELQMINYFGTPKSVEGAAFTEDGNTLILEVDFPAILEKYSSKTISIEF